MSKVTWHERLCGRFALNLAVFVCLVPDVASAEVPKDPKELQEAYKKLSEEPANGSRVLATLGFGTGLRFNNPYRLGTQLGQTAESLSLTSGYVDLGAAMAFGPADGLQHGATLHFSVALSGVSQQTITPGYFAAYRVSTYFLGYGRAGAAFLTMPDFNVGAELAGGLAYFLTGKVAVSADLIGNLFYGAATYEARYTVYPILSAQLGILVDHELLP